MDEIKKNANSIIRNHMVWSMGAGLIPVPVADFFAVGAIQLDMVRQLCKLYEIDFKETEGKAIISTLTSSFVAKMGARAAIKFIPGIGTVIGGITMVVLSGASTYAIGEVFKKHFETGGTILDFDTQRLRKFYDEMFEKGKKVASQYREKLEKKDITADEENPVDRLKDLVRMRDDGILTEEEFQKLKSRIIDEET